MIKRPKYLLSTKMLDEELLKRAASEKIFIECIPFIETRAIDNAQLGKEINKAVNSKYVIFTSTNAVDAISAQLTMSPDWKIFCISGKTKERVSQRFPDCEIVAEAASAKDLAKKIVLHKPLEAVFFCGNKRLDSIPKKLKESNISLKELVVYETVLTPVKIEKQYQGILFFSPSGVESFFSVNSIEEDIPVFAIGNTTAEVLKKFSKKIIVAKTPEATSIIEVIKNNENR